MKKLTGVLAIILACAVFVTAFAGCLASPQKQIIGKWKDSTGIVGYEFFEDGTVEFSLLSVPVKGTYTLDTKEDTVTITGTVLIKSITKTYKYQIEESTLILTDISSNDAVSYMRETAATTTKK